MTCSDLGQNSKTIAFILPLPSLEGGFYMFATMGLCVFVISSVKRETPETTLFNNFGVTLIFFSHSASRPGRVF